MEDGTVHVQPASFVQSTFLCFLTRQTQMIFVVNLTPEISRAPCGADCPWSIGKVWFKEKAGEQQQR